MPGRSLATMARADLLRCVQAHCFAMHDLALYLDTHPTDADALAAYLGHKQAFDEVAEIWAKRFGALTMRQVCKEDGWLAWSNTPWPWEKEAN